MKKVLFTLTLLWMTITSYGQTPDCSRFKNGTFTMINSEFKNYTIERKGQFQTETYQGKSSEFAVEWVDACTYRLVPTKKTLEQNPEYPRGGVVTVKIIEVKENSYVQTSTSNFSPVTMTTEFMKIK